jgi:hypothetical protein
MAFARNNEYSLVENEDGSQFEKRHGKFHPWLRRFIIASVLILLLLCAGVLGFAAGRRRDCHKKGTIAVPLERKSRPSCIHL